MEAEEDGEAESEALEVVEPGPVVEMATTLVHRQGLKTQTT